MSRVSLSPAARSLVMMSVPSMLTLWATDPLLTTSMLAPAGTVSEEGSRANSVSSSVTVSAAVAAPPPPPPPSPSKTRATAAKTSATTASTAPNQTPPDSAIPRRAVRPGGASPVAPLVWWPLPAVDCDEGVSVSIGTQGGRAARGAAGPRVPVPRDEGPRVVGPWSHSGAAGGDDERRARRRAGHGPGHAAQQQLARAPAPPGADHDEVGADLVGHREEGRRRVALGGAHLHGEAALAHRGDDRLEGRGRPGRGLLLVLGGGRRLGPEGEGLDRLDDLGDRQRGPEQAGEVRGQVERGQGEVGAVDPDEHLAHRHGLADPRRGRPGPVGDDEGRHAGRAQQVQAGGPERPLGGAADAAGADDDEVGADLLDDGRDGVERRAVTQLDPAAAVAGQPVAPALHALPQLGAPPLGRRRR